MCSACLGAHFCTFYFRMHFVCPGERTTTNSIWHQPTEKRKRRPAKSSHQEQQAPTNCNFAVIVFEPHHRGSRCSTKKISHFKIITRESDTSAKRIWINTSKNARVAHKLACVHWLTEQGQFWLKFDCHLSLMLDGSKFDDLTLIERPEV